MNHNFLVHFAESVGQELPLYKETLELRNESAYLRTGRQVATAAKSTGSVCFFVFGGPGRS